MILHDDHVAVIEEDAPIVLERDGVLLAVLPIRVVERPVVELEDIVVDVVSERSGVQDVPDSDHSGLLGIVENGGVEQRRQPNGEGAVTAEQDVRDGRILPAVEHLSGVVGHHGPDAGAAQECGHLLDEGILALLRETDDLSPARRAVEVDRPFRVFALTFHVLEVRHTAPPCL